ncbi:hypothetical protein EJB05_54727, partial [Eragrostis curvula]
MEVPDEILILILERIDSHISLIRAAAVCKCWRHTITNTDFLCRYRSLHSSTIAGNYHYDTPEQSYLIGSRAEVRRSVGLVFVPSSPSIHTRHFSLDFLPGMIDFPSHWDIHDSRGSLLLMNHRESNSLPHRHMDMFVCEPLTRRFRRIPPPSYSNDDIYTFRGSYLIDGADSHINFSNFRVMCLFIRRHDDYFSFATVFNEVGGAGSSWSDKTIGDAEPLLPVMSFLGCTKDSWHFYALDGILATLNKSTGEFSTSLLPSTEDWSSLPWKKCYMNVGVIDSHDGATRIVVISEDNSAKVFARLDGGEWALERRLMLSEVTRGLSGYRPSFFNHRLCISTNGPGFVILTAQPAAPWFFSIDLETMKVALAASDMGHIVYQSELPWPPALKACLGN